MSPVTCSGAALADPSPSSRDVERSENRVRERAAEVGRTKVLLAQADGELDRLTVAAEAAIERYHGERLKLQRAREAYAENQVRVVGADRRMEETRGELASFAAQVYQGGIGPGRMPSALAGHGGPQGYMDRAVMVEMVARRRAAVVERVRASRIVADVFRRQAQVAFVEQSAATKRADEAKRAAQDAVDRQRAAVQRIEAEKRRLEGRLGRAQAHAARVKRARERALEKAVARKVRAEFAGSEPSSAAVRGAVAVRAALEWLGTPYSWGGGTIDGPSHGVAQGAGTVGFDCSGLVMYAWHKAGVRLDHWTGTQWTSGPHVPVDDLRRGDLVFFAKDTSDPGTIHHVGLYLGRGRMVEAPFSGGRVRVSSIYRGDLIGATRPAG
ncbi:NlpC/P60 family protein [Actinomadura pelletieri]|uniref:C40 family peptidase n=1 Tax=Actinomadura pelletieri TaxID=111805 RepID=UPI001FEC5C96|nr:NlpC/P60 family protein [Actinomadura pelletieri]